MKVIVLAGGEGQQLDPLTEKMPASMVPVGNRPVMAFVLDLLARYQCKEVIVPLYRMGEDIEAHFRDGAQWELQLQYLHQDFWRGSAGVVKKILPDSDETILIMPANAIIDVDLTAVYDHHQANSNLITLITTSIRVVDNAVIAPLTVTNEGQVASMEEGSTTYSFTGAFFIESAILAEIPEETVYDVYGDLLPALLTKNTPTHTYNHTGYWNPMRTLAHVQEAQSVLLHSTYEDLHYDGHKVRFPNINGRQIAPGIYVSGNCDIHETVRLNPPVDIGENCRIGRDVVLGPNAFIGHSCILNDEVIVCDSTILPNTYMGQLITVDRKIVHKNRFIDIQTGNCTDIGNPLLLKEAKP